MLSIYPCVCKCGKRYHIGYFLNFTKLQYFSTAYDKANNYVAKEKKKLFIFRLICAQRYFSSFALWYIYENISIKKEEIVDFKYDFYIDFYTNSLCESI